MGPSFTREAGRGCAKSHGPVLGCAGCARCVGVRGAAPCDHGGVRVPEKPLTARDCADYMGFTPAWIRRAITDGVRVGPTIVTLDAETLTFNNRRTYRIHVDKFSEFLQAIGWKHLPHRTTATSAAPQRAGPQAVTR